MSLLELFTTQFGGRPTFQVISPGRVNLIGEHVDYNDGFVLPMAVPLRTEMLLRPREDGKVVLHSPIFQETREFTLGQESHQNAWVDYAQGVAVELAAEGAVLRGFEGVVTSDIPLASGLSSSASFEVAVALALSHVAGLSHTPSQVALLCQAAENRFVGVNCGIMDQMAVAACTRDHALLLDCRRESGGDYAMRQVPLTLQDHAIVVLDSDAPRELASSAYNERRSQCEEGLALLQQELPGVLSLRDVTPAQLETHAAKLPPVVLQRVRHIVSEIERTQRAVSQLEAGDLQGFGKQMDASHLSLQQDYAVTSPELDWLTDFSRNYPGVLGSRMTGAGFGGCIVTLVRKDAASSLIHAIVPSYKEKFGRNARAWVCEAEEGARALDLAG